MSTPYLNRFGTIDFSRIIERLTDGFVGREWLFQKLDHWLNEENGEKFYLLTGEPGVGKSAIAAQLTKRWVHEKVEENYLSAYHFCRAGDVETVRPGRVLRSLATQLGRTMPHYGEALQQVLDPVHLRIEVTINIGKLSNSQVTGIYVENLKELDPREEFRLLIQAPLAALSNLYTPPRPRVILIDSLDEAAATTGLENMVTLLASLYQTSAMLPKWVRFLLTSRSNQDVLDRFLPLQSKKIEELEAENLNDIQRYIQGRIDNHLQGKPSIPEPQAKDAPVSNSKPLKQRLEEADIKTEKLVQEIKELSKGNFLYTKLLLDSIVSGEQSIKNLAALPRNLNDVYHRTLCYRCSFRGWLRRYQLILGTLSVTQEPISQEQLGKFIGVTAEEIKKDLDIFRQFLDESKDEQEQTLYTIFHQSLREYLLNKKHNYDFWCDAKEQHHEIIKCFEKQSNKWQDLRALDLYGLRHLAQHLVQGGQQEELHILLTRENADRCNAWFDAKNSKNDTVGFLRDVSLAWQIAEQEPSIAKIPQSIVRQCRYALMTSSINGLAGSLPNELVMGLLKRDPTRGLAYFQQLIFSQQMDLQALNKIELQTLEPQLRQKLLEEVEKIPSESYKVQIKSALAGGYSSKELLEILESIKGIENEESKSKALEMLIPFLPFEKLSNTLEIINGFSDQTRSQILSIVPRYFQGSRELLINVLDMSLELYGQQRADVLIGIAPYLSEDLLSEALNIALDASDQYANEYSQTRALSGLATAQLNADLIEKIQDKARTFKQEHQTQILSALSPHLPPTQLDEILEKVQALEYDVQKAEILSALSSRIPPDQLHKILQKVKVLSSEFHKAQVLSTLVFYVTSNLLHEILQEAQAFTSEYHKALVLSETANAFSLTSKVIENIQQQAESFQDRDYKAQVLSTLAMHLSKEQLYKILQEIQTIKDDYHQIKTIRHLLAHLPLESVKHLSDQMPSDSLHSVLQKIDYQYYEGLTLRDVTICIPSERLQQILQEVQMLDSEHHKALSLKGIATTANLTTELVESIQQQAESFQKEVDRTQVLSTLAMHLPTIQINKILQEIQSIEDGNDKANALNTLAYYLPSNHLLNVLQEVQAIEDEFDKIQVLSTLALRLLSSDRSHNRLHDEHKTQVLRILTTNVCSNPLSNALSKEESGKALALGALAPYLTSEELQKVLETIREIQNDFARNDSLRVLAFALLRLPYADLYRLWVETLHMLASRNRRSLLSDLRGLAPIVVSLGNDEAIAELCHAIQDIGRQWP